MAATFIFGKRKTRLGVESSFEECRTRLGSALVVFVVRRMVVSVISAMPCDGSKESVSPGLATKKLKSGSRLAGHNYFRCCFPGKSKPMRGINVI